MSTGAYWPILVEQDITTEQVIVRSRYDLPRYCYIRIVAVDLTPKVVEAAKRMGAMEADLWRLLHPDN